MMDTETLATPMRNHALKEDIRLYWSKRAETFDQSTGHKIDDRVEAREWQALFAAGLGDLTGRHVLDIACGTGEISRMLLAMGATVTGVDFAEPMLERARRKNAGARFRAYLGDAEALRMEDDAHYDAVINRHLVWTLTDPHAAFAEWARVLKPGGRLLIVDGDWVNTSFMGRILRAIANRMAQANSIHGRATDLDEHNRILSQVHYARGLTPELLQADLAPHGFGGFTTHSMRAVYGRGMRHAPLADRLRLIAPRRFAVSAVKLV